MSSNMAAAVDPAARTRIIHSAEPVLIVGRPYEKYPIVVRAESGVLLPAAAYLRDLAQWKSRAEGTVCDEAGIICDWCDWLRARGRDWDRPSKSEYLTWLNTQTGMRTFAAPRRGRKASVIWTWYGYLKREGFGGRAVSEFFDDVTEADESGAPSGRMRFETGKGDSTVVPEVPSRAQVDLILDALADNEDRFAGERNWLLGRCEAEVGLRAMGVHSMTTRHIDMMLRKEGILAAKQTMAFMASDAQGRVRIREALQRLEAQDRRELEATITEKGGKTRAVVVPIPLALSLLEHVWGARESLLRSGRGGASRAKTKGAIFLSSTDGRPLERGSIKDIVARAFRQCSVPKSGHKLRAFYLTKKAIELVREARRLHGKNYDETTVLNQLAQIAGHNRRKTLRFYLDPERIKQAMLDMYEESGEEPED